MASAHDNHGDNHGQTPAAWTAVTLVMLAFVFGTLAVVLGNWPMFWIGGVALAVVGMIAGKVMSMMGMGAGSRTSPERPMNPVDNGPGGADVVERQDAPGA